MSEENDFDYQPIAETQPDSAEWSQQVAFLNRWSRLGKEMGLRLVQHKAERVILF